MGAQFSDPAWWPKPPPRPPKPISVAKVVFGTLVPGAALIAGAVFVFTQHPSRSAGAATPSVAAFDACVRAHGSSPAQAGGTAAQRAVRACSNRLPPGTHVGSFGAPSTEQEQFTDCVRSATADLPRGGGAGRFAGGSGARQAFESAVEVCRTLIQGGGGTTTPGPTTTSSTAPPPAA